MIVVIPVDSSNENSAISILFGRATFFCIYNTLTKTHSFIENSFKNDTSGVGKNVSNLLFKTHKAKMLVTFELGLKFQEFANKNEVQIVLINKQNKFLNSIITLINSRYEKDSNSN